MIRTGRFLLVLQFMEKFPDHDSLTPSDNSTREILEWLAAVHGQISIDDGKGLLNQLHNLRIAALSNVQRQKLLDLLYLQAQSLTEQELDQLDLITLPVSRKVRHNTKILLHTLEMLTQDYLNSLAAVFDPDRKTATASAQTSLRRAMQTMARQIQTYHRIAAPPPPGLWQQFHTAYSNARRLKIENQPGISGTSSIQRLYISTLLAAIAQPASFTPPELRLIAALIESIPQAITLEITLPAPSPSIFWIDPSRDFPAHAIVRRPPAPDCEILYFSADIAASHAASTLNALQNGLATLPGKLPPLTKPRDTQRVLKRLIKLWANPSKRRYPRRRQSYRSQVAIGLTDIHHHLSGSTPDSAPLSEWMVTNESPDGFSLMHMAGNTPQLTVGDLVAIKAHDPQAGKETGWQICILRWAISENPEHIEIGLQLLSSSAKPAQIITPEPRRLLDALLLPEAPTLRRNKAIVVPQDTLTQNSRGVIIMIEATNLALHEIRTTSQDEQSNTCDIFFIQADGTGNTA